MIDGILDTGAIEQLTEKHWLSPFPQFQTSERPDKCAVEILNGRILLLCDHSPTGILLPAVLNDFLQVSEDNYNHFEIVSFQRLIRYFALFLTLLFSGTYLAVSKAISINNTSKRAGKGTPCRASEKDKIRLVGNTCVWKLPLKPFGRQVCVCRDRWEEP